MVPPFGAYLPGWTDARVEIGRTVERELGKRGTNQYTPKKERENFPAPVSGRNRDIAAEKAGFGNGKTYEQAKAVASETLA